MQQMQQLQEQLGQQLKKMREQMQQQQGQSSSQLSEEEKELVLTLKKKLIDYHLSARTMSGMKRADIETIGDLVSHNKMDLLKIRDFGKKSLLELDDLVDSLNLTFGMDVQKYLIREADSYTI